MINFIIIVISLPILGFLCWFFGSLLYSWFGWWPFIIAGVITIWNIIDLIINAEEHEKARQWSDILNSVTKNVLLLLTITARLKHIEKNRGLYDV